MWNARYPNPGSVPPLTYAIEMSSCRFTTLLSDASLSSRDLRDIMLAPIDERAVIAGSAAPCSMPSSRACAWYGASCGGKICDDSGLPDVKDKYFCVAAYADGYPESRLPAVCAGV
jgi:hypothetical protein